MPARPLNVGPFYRLADLLMREVIAEFETTRGVAPDAYGDAGCRLSHLNRCAMVLRHERYTTNSFDTIYLFARHPELGAQVFIEVFPAEGNPSDWEKKVGFYEEQRTDHRLPKGQVFDEAYLAPVASGFMQHGAFRTRDGRTRRRVVHTFTGTRRNVLVVYSSDSADMLASPFFAAVRDGLALSDAAVAGPFRR